MRGESAPLLPCPEGPGAVANSKLVMLQAIHIYPHLIHIYPHDLSLTPAHGAHGAGLPSELIILLLIQEYTVHGKVVGHLRPGSSQITMRRAQTKWPRRRQCLDFACHGDPKSLGSPSEL